jgi:hypothetical protein
MELLDIKASYPAAYYEPAAGAGAAAVAEAMR